ncbi:MAG: UPF0175 family protein [Candidatus Diapherotrites archaeon]
MEKAKAIGIRLDKGLLEKIDRLSKAEHFDRSTIIRLLLEEGYGDYVKKKAAENYMAGKITISMAAELSNSTVWELEQYLVKKGFKSQYSIEDLNEELKNLAK